MDHLATSVDSTLPPGEIVILPSSFPGRPRVMHRSYMDAMTLVTHFGKCNAKWSAISHNLLPHQ